MNIEDFIDKRLMLRDLQMHPKDKLFSLAQAGQFVAEAHKIGKTVVLVEGTWDLTHAGHVQHILEAMKHGDLVLLRLASAAYAEKFKGAGRPIEVHREIVVSEFEDVDGVFVDMTAIDPDNIPDNAKILALLNIDKVALETEDDKLAVKLASIQYAREHLGAHIEPVVFTLDHLNSTTQIINHIKGMP